MKIDYASYTFVPPPRKPNLRRYGLFLSIFVLIAVVAAGGWLYVKMSGSPPLQHLAAKFQTLFHHKKSEGIKKAPQTEVESPPVQFNFYSELPNMRVTASVPTEKKATVKQEVPPVTGQTMTGQKYVLQLGIFKDLNSASQHRLSLLLLGLETQVIPVTVNGAKLYQVQQGPYATSADVKTAQKKLLKKGIDGTIKVE